MPAPAIDDYQNITNLRMERVTEGGQTYQVMYFRRPVCSDNEDDMALSLQPYLLYAWGNINNDDVDDIMGHMMTDRGPSAVRYDFLCGGKQATTTIYNNSTHKSNYPGYTYVVVKDYIKQQVLESQQILHI